ncbi:MAG: CRISPR-associated endonuclease Cas2 [Candidatus Moranbacteria bacterium]|nr:CRISPR-associated endonuclease Cas2 [Candidatus Moranbacteria bacterium]OIQ03522.1 MAG: CRISPR-associated endonuclease Cas2 [Candidatus Moranbacteria bacterium CG2_30_41_165]PIP25749.1 MAG: CRISPR-associated endonuclease Cas2 [Candidatus Moranbacteria bacterium CG23_combo_of_CG06-09_8_20_14_all_41_28]PIV85986.1 MAG: CRISPR-associated endonuclease Cas2 [Candidatus Moranbacteria bacterium CG17_big_fil_post_rev_8_21_14_2_50_41_107]PIW94115.1 MAG: CRISPR-associated endonuclease Cas2 [Candidatus 
MLILSYDFESNKTRARFAKFILKYGRRIQYSVFEIRNSDRVLRNILDEVELKYSKKFTGADSIVIFQVCEGCKKKVIRYGYAKNEETEIVVF